MNEITVSMEEYKDLVKAKTRIEIFAEYIKKEGAPLDFFSWHCYASRVEQMLHMAKDVRDLLDPAFSRTLSAIKSLRVRLDSTIASIRFSGTSL